MNLKKLSTVFERAAHLVEKAPNSPHYYYAMDFASEYDTKLYSRAKRAAEKFFGDIAMPLEDADTRVIAFGFLAAIAKSEGK